MDKRIVTELTATNVISAANMANYLEFTATDATESALILTLLKGAIRLCEDYTGSAFATKTVEVVINSNELDEDGRIDLPYFPFGAMSDNYPVSIDIEGTETELTLNTDYYLNGGQRKSIRFLTVSSLVGFEEFSGWYKLRYTCGYDIADTTEPIPENYKFAVMEQVKRWYEREYDGKLDMDVIKILQRTANLTVI